MSRNIIKQLQSEIKHQNQKMIKDIKEDIEKTYNQKMNEISEHYKNSETKIKRAYTTFITKLKKYKEKDAKEHDELKEKLESIQKAIKQHEFKRARMGKKIMHIEEELKNGLKKELDDNTKLKIKIEKDVNNLKAKTDVKTEKIKDEKDINYIKEILTSLM